MRSSARLYWVSLAICEWESVLNRRCLEAWKIIFTKKFINRTCQWATAWLIVTSMINSVDREKFKWWLGGTHPPGKVIISARFQVWFSRPEYLFGSFDSLHVVEIQHSFAIYVNSLAILLCVIFLVSFAWAELLSKTSPQRSILAYYPRCDFKNIAYGIGIPNSNAVIFTPASLVSS